MLIHIFLPVPIFPQKPHYPIFPHNFFGRGLAPNPPLATPLVVKVCWVQNVQIRSKTLSKLCSPGDIFPYRTMTLNGRTNSMLLGPWAQLIVDFVYDITILKAILDSEQFLIILPYLYYLSFSLWSVIRPFQNAITTVYKHSIYSINLCWVKDIQGPKSFSYHVTLLPTIWKIHVTVSRESRYRLPIQILISGFIQNH